MKSSKVDIVETIYARIAGMDLRADWLLGSGASDYLPDGDETLIPFMLTLRDQSAADVVNKFRDSRSFYIPSWYLENDSLQPRRLIYAYARKQFFLDLATNPDFEPLREADKEIVLCSPLQTAAPGDSDPFSEPLEEPDYTPESDTWPEDTVVVGVIDDGIAIGHDHFQHRSGTRVQFYWRQDGPDESTVPHGSELTRDKINNLLIDNQIGGSSVVEEDSFYRHAGIVDYSEDKIAHKATSWRAAHGTHVLDLAAGAPRADDIRNRPIIAVQLPSESVEDTTGTLWENYVKSGIDYILRRADLMTPPGKPKLPVVINFSFGTYTGPHDGTSALEQDFNNQIQSRPNTRMVLPSGNAHQSRCHAHISFAKKTEIAELHWRVPPDDHTPSFLSIWLPYQTPPQTDRVEVEIEEPGGLVSPALGEPTPTTAVAFFNDDGEQVCFMQNNFVGGLTQRTHYCISLRPTSRISSTGPVAPSGIWKIRIKNLKLKRNQNVEAWIARSESIYGYPRRGRQSYFDNACYERFTVQGDIVEEDNNDCIIQRAGMINGIATGEEPIVIGGIYRDSQNAARYSAGGPTTTDSVSTTPHRDGPDAVSVSDDSLVRRGVLAAGIRSGSTVAFSGTSVAAPQIARNVADQLAAGGSADRSAIGSRAAPSSGSPQRYGKGVIVLPHPYMTVTR